MSTETPAPREATRPDPKIDRAWLFGIAAIPFLVLFLFPVLSGGYFGDDFQFVFENPSSTVLGAFARLHPYGLYRPIEFSAASLAKVAFGDTTLPLHVLNLIVHAGLVVLCVRILAGLRAPKYAPFLASAWLVTSQSNAAALGGNDTLSLVLGTLTGTMAAWWLCPLKPLPARNRTGALLLYTVALFSKESSLGYLPVLIGLTGLGVVRGVDRPATAVRWSMAFLMATVLFMTLRQSLGAELPGSGTRPFAIGPHVVTNSVMIHFSALTPISTLEQFSGAMERRFLWPAAGMAGAWAVVLIIVTGLGREGRLIRLLMLVAAGECVIAPVLFQRRVSELYGYALLPLVAMAFGWAAASVLDRARTSRIRAALVALLAVVFLCQSQAQVQKAQGMARSGEMATVQMRNLLSLAEDLPPRAALILVEPEHDRPEYSVYRMTGFRLTPPEEIERLSSRRDIVVRYAGEPVPGEDRARIAVTLDGRRPLVLPP